MQTSYDTIHIVYPTGFQRTYKRIQNPHLISNPVAVAECIFSEWNNGSNVESEEFLNANVRSLMVGDWVGVNGQYFLCKSAGWSEVTLQSINIILDQIHSRFRQTSAYSVYMSTISGICYDYRNTI